MGTASPEENLHLDLESTIGFCGSVSNGLKVHPDKEHLIYPVGCTVVIENLSNKKQEFLAGHTDNVSCLAISKNGDYIASGQETHMGFKAAIIVWNFKERKMCSRLMLHMVKVEALAFSPNAKYLVSLGGADDGSVVVWDRATGDAICGAPAQVQSAGMTQTIAYANQSDDKFFTGGDGTLRAWVLDLANRKIRPTDCNMGQIKRVIKCIEIAEDDSFMYCGTTTGDILAVNLQSDRPNFQVSGPEKGKFSQGVTALALLKTGDLLIGAGDGTVAILGDRKKKFKRTPKQAQMQGAVTSLALRGQGHQFFVGTNKSNIYKFNFSQFSHELTTTCHYGEVKNVCFPHLCSELYGTCSFQDVRIWNPVKNQELLRITVPNMTCNALDFAKDGKSIITGWDDGRIRAFAPESGKSMFTINDAHQKGVTALTVMSDSKSIISGGKGGDIRVWKVSTKVVPKGYTYVTDLHHNLKEHQASVTCIKVTSDDQQCATSSTDGTCIIWCLLKGKRLNMIRVNTLFKYVCYHPDNAQIITTGTDRKIAYWETGDASMIRELEGSKSGSINGMDISSDGKFFVSGGDDRLVKVWKYDEGEVTHIGIGHGAPITNVRISPDESFIISVSNDGAILKWKFPFDLTQTC